MRLMTLLGIVIIGLLLLWFSYGGPAILPWQKLPAYCLCSCTGYEFIRAGEREEFHSYVRSERFILAILHRDAKYGELIPEAKNFWQPTVQDGLIQNEVATAFDKSYQDLFNDLRDDIYAELDYQVALILLRHEALEDVRFALSLLDHACKENPLLDVVGKVKYAHDSTNSKAKKAYIARALLSAHAGEPLEVPILDNGASQ